jgi:hypothetical protein
MIGMKRGFERRQTMMSKSALTGVRSEREARGLEELLGDGSMLFCSWGWLTKVVEGLRKFHQI